MRVPRRSLHTTIVVLLSLLAAGPLAHSQTRRPMTLIDQAELPRIAGAAPQLSPDGKTLVYLLSRTDWKASRLVFQIWRQETAGGAPVQLTFSDGGVQGGIDPPLRWSPDGKTLLFLRDGQISLLPVGGGEPRALTKHATNVSAPSWSPDGATVYFLASDPRTAEEREVHEINPGIYAGSRAFFVDALARLKPNNAQGELYLTDVVSMARAGNVGIDVVRSRGEVLVGINDRAQLADAEAVMQRRILERWRKEGVTIRDGARVEDAVVIEPDATVESHAVLRGTTHVGAGVIVDVGCVITNVTLGAGTHVKPYSVLERSTIGKKAMIGPFSHVRPDSELADEVHLGNFVETKKTKMAKGAKANHLAYLGDGVIGERVNVGAGTIFCNYDGFNKHVTTIEADAFIGSDSQLVAPVTVGAGAYVATGTTVTMDVPPDALAIARTRQENKAGYASKLKARMKALKDAKK